MPKYPDNKKAVGAASSTGKKGGKVGAKLPTNKESVNAAISAPGKGNKPLAGLGKRYESAAMKDAAKPSKKGHGSPSSGGPAGMKKKSLVNADKDKGHGRNKGSQTPPTV